MYGNLNNHSSIVIYLILENIKFYKINALQNTYCTCVAIYLPLIKKYIHYILTRLHTTILLMGYMIFPVRCGITCERHKEKNNVHLSLSFQVINFQRHIADTRGVIHTILQKDLKS